MTATLIKSGGTFADAPFGRLTRDPVLDGAGDGALFGFDAAFDWSFPYDSTPANAAPVLDLAENADGGFYRPAGQAGIIALNGGGIDLYNLTEDGCEVRGPAGCLTSLEDEQEYLILGWAKMPTSGNWNTGAVISPIFTCSGGNGYDASADLLTISQSNVPRFSSSRQISVGSQQSPNLGHTNLTPFYERITQWAFWRTADECGLRMKSSLGEELITGDAGALNSGSLSALMPRWGVPEAWNQHVTGGSSTAHRAAGHRLYRGYIENLHASGRDPVEVLDMDWDFIARLGSRYS